MTVILSSSHDGGSNKSGADTIIYNVKELPTETTLWELLQGLSFCRCRLGGQATVTSLSPCPSLTGPESMPLQQGARTAGRFTSPARKEWDLEEQMREKARGVRGG